MLKETKHFWIVSSTLYLTAAMVSAIVAIPQTYISTTQATASSPLVSTIASSTSTSTVLTTKSNAPASTTTASTTTASTTTASTTTASTSTTTATRPTTQTNGIVTRAPHLIGVATAEIYKRVTPDCSVEACSDTALSVDLARSLIHCAAMCSQSPKCLYYRTMEYNETPDPRDKICYLYGLPPTLTEDSYKFMGQA